MAADLLAEAWLVFLFSLIASALVFPLVIVFSFVYSLLEKANPRMPKFILMALVTFIAVVCAVVLLEVYFGYTLAGVAAAATAAP